MGRNSDGQQYRQYQQSNHLLSQITEHEIIRRHMEFVCKRRLYDEEYFDLMYS